MAKNGANPYLADAIRIARRQMAIGPLDVDDTAMPVPYRERQHAAADFFRATLFLVLLGLAYAAEAQEAPPSAGLPVEIDLQKRLKPPYWDVKTGQINPCNLVDSGVTYSQDELIETGTPKERHLQRFLHNEDQPFLWPCDNISAGAENPDKPAESNSPAFMAVRSLLAESSTNIRMAKENLQGIEYIKKVAETWKATNPKEAKKKMKLHDALFKANKQNLDTWEGVKKQFGNLVVRVRQAVQDERSTGSSARRCAKPQHNINLLTDASLRPAPYPPNTSHKDLPEPFGGLRINSLKCGSTSPIIEEGQKKFSDPVYHYAQLLADLVQRHIFIATKREETYLLIGYRAKGASGSGSKDVAQRSLLNSVPGKERSGNTRVLKAWQGILTDLQKLLPVLKKASNQTIKNARKLGRCMLICADGSEPTSEAHSGGKCP